MSNLETPGSDSSRGLGGIENGEPSDTAAQFSTPSAQLDFLGESRDELSSFGSTFWEGIASEDDLAAPINFASSRPPESTRNDLKRKAAISNHKGVHFKKKNKKFVSRLCLPEGKSRKLDLGEYNTHDEAARAYQVGAFYYNKSGISDCGEDLSFLKTLPCVPDNLSSANKLIWVRERARHSAASIGTSERRGIRYPKPALESGGSSFDARPGTAASYGTQGSCDDYHSTPTTPTISRSAYPDNSLGGSGENGAHATTLKKVNDYLFDNMGEDQVDSLHRSFGDALDYPFHGETAAFFKVRESKRRNSVQTQSQGSPNVELQQGRNSNALTNQAPVVDHQSVSQVKFTDSVLFALVELRKQGWEWTLKLRSPSSVETGVLFSVPKGQHVAPALRITDTITNSFHELRKQGWEVHLQPHKGGNGELISQVCVAPTLSAVQDKMETSRFFAVTLRIGSWVKLEWEVLESGHRRKMEILWSEIDTMKATYSNFDYDTLEIHVSRPPSFFERSRPWLDWKACTDFTEGQASTRMLHSLKFPQGVLKNHYEKLVQCDPRLKNADTRAWDRASDTC